MSQIISLNAFKVIEGRPVTSSRIVAEYFGKQHHHVVRDIRSLIEQKPSLEASANFGEWSEEVEIGSGAKRTVTGYWMDQKGFCILAMGFTGAKALEFKCAFYDEFERMKNELEAPTTITPAEQLQIQQAVARRAKTSSANYQTIYRAIKVRFQIPRYTELPTRQFAECLKFIDAVDLKVPEAKTAAAPKQEPRALPKSGKPNLTPLNIPEGRKMYRVSEDFLEKQRTFVYCWRYLFRDDLKLFYNFLKQTESPLAPKFAEAIMDFNLYFVEDSLAKLGFAVKDLDCYKHWEAKRLAV